MSAAAPMSSSHPSTAPDDTLELLFNENDGILTAETDLAIPVQPQPNSVPHELDSIISSILKDQTLLNGGSDDLDLDEFLQDSGHGVDVMDDILNAPHEAGDDGDSFLGSPPLLPPASNGHSADPGLVSRDHSYLGSGDHVCDFSPQDSAPTDSSTRSPSPPDVPLFLGKDIGEQRSAPGPMRHSRRSRNSGSGSSLPYTVHDLALSSPGSFEEENSCSAMGRRSQPPSDDSALGSPGELLVLTDEERLLLAREGVDLPDHLPLTREEERALRTVRRKIRNKISAKNSRLKKQEYVTGLEQRVKLCSRENRSLRGSVDSLRSQNRQLLLELRRFRQWVSDRLPGVQPPFGGSGKIAFYALMLSFALVLTPLLSPFWSSSVDPVGYSRAPGVLPGRSRTLLQEKEAAVQLGAPYHITVRPLGPPWQVPPQSLAIPLVPHRSGTAPAGPNASEASETDAPGPQEPPEAEVEEEEGRVREL